MSRAAEHLHHLATVIGPRPATTDAEAEAADYIESVFREHSVAVERQEFDAPRTYAWAFALYHLLTIAAAVASGWTFLLWPALAVATLTAFLMWMDLDTRFGLSAWLPPKGPSQNVIARHTPKTRRGERPTRVIIVAHYDTAKASLAFAPSMVKNFSVTFGLMKACTFAVPALVLLAALPFTAGWQPWLWYVTIAASAYLAVPLVINAHRELAMPAVDGANDNASGVAVMLGVLERIAPFAEESGTTSFPSVRRGRAAAEAAGVVPEGAELFYEGEEAASPTRGAGDDLTELPDDFRWAETPAPAPRGAAPAAQGRLEFETIEFDALGPDDVGARPAAVPDGFGDESPGFGGFGDDEADEGFDAPRRSATRRDETPARGGVADRAKGLLGKLGRRGRSEDEAPEEGWLGVGRDFDVRETGRKIGSWENFGEDDDDDGFGAKGGRAGDDPLGDPDFAATEASRIRRRVTERVDRALADKEVWFVATGAEETGTWGMQAFLDAHGPDVRGALVINLDNLGSGGLHMVTEEGMARRYRADRRLLSAGKRVSRESELPVRTRPYRGLSTDATRALARGYRAMSLMAFDINGRLPHWHWPSDVEEHVDPRNLEHAEAFVTELVRAL